MNYNTKESQQIQQDNCGLDWSGMKRIEVNIMELLMDFNISNVQRKRVHWLSLKKFNLATNLKQHCSGGISKQKNCIMLKISMKA